MGKIRKIMYIQTLYDPTGLQVLITLLQTIGSLNVKPSRGLDCNQTNFSPFCSFFTVCSSSVFSGSL